MGEEGGRGAHVGGCTSQRGLVGDRDSLCRGCGLTEIGGNGVLGLGRHGCKKGKKDTCIVILCGAVWVLACLIKACNACYNSVKA